MRTIYFLLILILSSGCLKTKKSSFDMSSGGITGLFIFGFANGLFGSSDKTPPSVSITNIKSKGVIEFGILKGTSSDNVEVSLVELQLNSEAFQSATGTTSWIWKLPAKGWIGGANNTINVRVTDKSGNSTVSVLTSMTKGINKDINGDGYPDLAVGASNLSTGLGKVYIYDSSNLSAANVKTITGETASSYFGYSVQLGDFNGDGYADLAVGAYNYFNGTFFIGKVYIFYSSGANGITATSASGADRTITGETVNSYNFGNSMTVGDFNGDGYADLAVSAYNYLSVNYIGRVYIFYSAGANGIGATSASSANVMIDGETGANNYFGHSINSGDLNGDGIPDLIVNAWFYNSNQGRLYIFYSASGTGISITSASSANKIITGESVQNFFGHSTAVADVNGDGYKDLIAGAYKYNNTNQGRVYVFHSSSSGITASSASSANTIIDGEAGANQFGYALTAGDLNGDGYSEIVVSADQYSTAQGRTYIFTGTSSGITTTLASSAGTIINGETSSQFGAALRIADLNNDGYNDLIAGGAQYSSSLGRAYVFSSSKTGVTQTSASGANTILTGEGGNFGISLY